MEPPLEVGRGGCGSALSTVHQGRLRRHYTRRESENGTARGEGGGGESCDRVALALDSFPTENIPGSSVCFICK